jgi:hypothetical protein
MTKSIVWSILEVWARHCGCNICPKNLKFLVNMWFSTSFKTHNFYKILIFSLGVMPQNQNTCELRAAWVAKKHLLVNFFGLDFFSYILNKVLKHIINLKKVLRHIEFTRKMLKDQLHLCKIKKKAFETM